MWRTIKVIGKVIWIVLNLFGLIMGFTGWFETLGGLFNYTKEQGGIVALSFTKKHKKFKKRVKEGKTDDRTKDIAKGYFYQVVIPGWKYALE